MPKRHHVRDRRFVRALLSCAAFIVAAPAIAAEVTPARLVTAIVTERGMVDASAGGVASLR